jgi:hypothetical protein
MERKGREMNLLIAILSLAALSPAVAQDKPNFAGRWTAEAPPAGRGARSGDMGSGWGSTITVTQDAATLTVEYAFFARGDMQAPLKFTYSLAGAETRNSVMMGRGIQMETSKAQWDGARLVIVTASAYPSPADGKPMTSEVKRTLSLDSSGSLVVETTRAGILGAAPTTARVVYKKG